MFNWGDGFEEGEEGDYPGGWSGDEVPACDEGDAEGDASDFGSADDSVYCGGGCCVGY